MAQKINFKDEGITNNDSGLNRRSTSIAKPNDSLSKRISAAGTGKTCHTVTPVILNSPDYLSIEGLDFILSHVTGTIWPRTISTKSTGGSQVIVYTKEEALAYFRAAYYMDCRISAYPYWRPSKVSDFMGIKNPIPPYLIMIDLDLSDSNNEINAINHALRKTLQRINHLLGFMPTVIWSGNGYHIYVPINAVVLEDVKEFANIEQVSTKFLRFAEWYLSSAKSDHAHNSTVSLNNCMLRIPGSYNSKNNTLVETIKKWDKNRPNITLLLGSFCAYFRAQKIKEQMLFRNQSPTSISTLSIIENIPWIDRLLQTAITDGRKYCIWRILVPYLVNKRQLSMEETFTIIKDWLNGCARVSRLNFSPSYRITYSIEHVGKHLPVQPYTLRIEYDMLYDLLGTQRVL